jgi:tetratricopeptide (TPR) repeat protein
MKITGTFLLRFFPFTGTFLLLHFFFVASFAQEVIVANNEPTVLYKKANESLSMGDTRLAINIFEKVIDFYESEGRVKELSESYLGMALSFAFNGNYPESIRYHKKALRAHHKYRPNESDDAIMLNLGLAYQLAGKERKAKKYLN